MTDPDLLAALRDLTTAVCQLCDELRQHRQVERASIEALIALHREPQTGEMVHHEEEAPYG